MNAELLGRQLADSDVSNEELAARVRIDHSRPALNALIRRCYPLVRRWVRRLAKGVKLGRDAVEDAQQDAVFAIRAAARRYRGDCHRCHFCTFLNRVVRDRFHDFVRHWRRERNPDHRARRGVSCLETSPARWELCLAGPGRTDLDPATAAMTADAAEAIHRILDRLSLQERNLCRRMGDGIGHHRIARELGVSLPTLKRLWRRLKDKLAVALIAVGTA
jgi:RNA polymerase sigma factor (sigma-70 family)